MSSSIAKLTVGQLFAFRTREQKLGRFARTDTFEVMFRVMMTLDDVDIELMLGAQVLFAKHLP